jgi:L-seryl-tRNA(Ser) seleniumtransferase
MNDPRSSIPAVDAILADHAAHALVERFGRGRTVQAIRAAIEEVRAEIARDPAPWAGRASRPEEYLGRARAALEEGEVPSLRHVINGTGVVLHTNLGRAPLAEAAVDAMRRVAGRYTNLEYDLDEGRRGSRYVHCVSLLTELSGADDALVVNNAAAALILALNTLALGRGVAVSRGELVEIGGGFRIPEMIERAGARLVEVGSTNRTRVGDYEAALGPETKAILKVHRSNFRITGFTEEASVAELAELAADHEVPLVHDLGSGLMVPATELGLPDEPRAAESLAAGADVVVVSGDKLLGGTQAGVILGRADLIGRMRRNPLCRALRVDKVTLAGLEATLRLYRRPERVSAEIPTLAMLRVSTSELEARARALCARIREVLGSERADRAGLSVVRTRGAVGGGTYPGVELDSWAVALRPAAGPHALADVLRRGSPPVVGRIVDDVFTLDVRTVFSDQEDELARRLDEALRGAEAAPT